MEYETTDLIIGDLNLQDPAREGCGPEGTKIRVKITKTDVLLFVGPRDWQWDRATGKLIGAGTSLCSGGAGLQDSTPEKAELSVQ
jgi:hypothetical protein